MEGATIENIWGVKRETFIALVLRFLTFTKPFEVHTNVSDFAIYGVFMQDGHPIAFNNNKFCGA
jgi:hypothetical protein